MPDKSRSHGHSLGDHDKALVHHIDGRGGDGDGDRGGVVDVVHADGQTGSLSRQQGSDHREQEHVDLLSDGGRVDMETRFRCF